MASIGSLKALFLPFPRLGFTYRHPSPPLVAQGVSLQGCHRASSRCCLPFPGSVFAEALQAPKLVRPHSVLAVDCSWTIWNHQEPIVSGTSSPELLTQSMPLVVPATKAGHLEPMHLENKSFLTPGSWGSPAWVIGKARALHSQHVLLQGRRWFPRLIAASGDAFCLVPLI